jgi:exopolysaccharide production protein ExoQ
MVAQRGSGRSIGTRGGSDNALTRAASLTAAIATAALLLLCFAGPYINSDLSAKLGLLGTIRQAGYPIVFVIALAAAYLIGGWRSLVLPWPMLAALGWCWLSVSWALAPVTAAKAALLLTLVAWPTFVLVRALDPRRTALILDITLALALLVNIGFAIFVPEVATTTNLGSTGSAVLSGVTGDKNQAGLIAGLAIVTFAARWYATRWVIYLPLIVAGAGFLILTDSRTSIGMTIAALIFMAVFARAYPALQAAAARRPALPLRVEVIGAVIIAAIVGYLSIDISPALQLASDPEAFTGRAAIWTAVIRYFGEYPLLGSGYGSFWNIGEASPILRYIPPGSWIEGVSEAHNGYLEMMIQLGGIGFVLVFFATLIWPAARLLRLAPERRGLGVWAASILFFMFGHNFTEANLFNKDAMGNVVMLFAVALIWRETRTASVGDQLRARAAQRAGGWTGVVPQHR